MSDQEPPFKSPDILQETPVNEEPTGKIFPDLEIFFQQLNRSFKGRYALWENTFLSALKLLRIIENQDNTNTNKIIEGLDFLEQKILKTFEQYKVKLNEVERYSDIEFRKISQDFKHTLDLLRMEIREYVLNKEINKLYAIYKNN